MLSRVKFNEADNVVTEINLIKERRIEELLYLSPFETKLFFIKSFSNYFEKKGYKVEKSLSLLTDIKNSSILFSNSAINYALKSCQSEEGIKKHSVVQNCLRTQNLTIENDSQPEYISNFNMGGIFDQFEHREGFISDLMGFFNYYKPGKNQFKIAIDLSQKNQVEAWKKTGLEFTNHPEEKYTWQFGNKLLNGNIDHNSENLRGEGSSLMMKTNNYYEEVGNFIIIYKEDTPLMIGFGFGIETFLSNLSDQDIHPIFFTKLQKELKYLPNNEYNNAQYIHLLDCLNILITLKGEGITPGNRGRRNVMKKTINKLKSASKEINNNFLFKNDISKFL